MTVIKLSPHYQLVSLTNYAIPCIWDTAPKALRDFLGLPDKIVPQCACTHTGCVDLL